MSKFKVKTNMDGVIRELDEFLKQHDGVMIKASVWSEVEYAKFVEFGTYKMVPKAMIRKAMPAIEDFFLREWKTMPFPFKESDLRALWNKTIEFAQQEISRYTPVKTGVLKESWKITKARIYKGRAGKQQT